MIASRRSVSSLLRSLLWVVFGWLPVTPSFAMLEGSFLYFPSHVAPGSDLQSWTANGQGIGYARPVSNPKRVWLMFHGNAGQASQRGYICESLPVTDAVFIMEYPGYGQRAGTPSMQAINTAALAAYAELTRTYPQIPIGVV